ncbi:MAG: hypothetical protein WD294_15050 [Phycisphaeraceae bacterium]
MGQADQIVRKVQQCLSRGGEVVPTEAVELALQCSDLVEAVNERLGRCTNLLRQGLRSEALHQAELSPPILDEAAALDFPENERWAEFCAKHDLAVAPRVDIEAVGELDEAYPVEQELADLLKEHRLLALKRAPLPSRIAVLRQLAEADPTNPMWAEDVGTLEGERYKQIAAEADAAYRQMNLPKLGALRQEVTERWQEKPSAKLVRRVSAAFDRVQSAQAVQTLRDLAPVVEQTQITANAEKMAKLLERVWTLQGLVRAPDVVPLREVFDPARQWLEEVRQQQADLAEFENALAGLERGLDDKEGKEELERRWRAATRLGHAIPEAVTKRYRGRASALELGRQRRFRLTMAAIVGLLVLLGGGTAWITMSTLEAREVEGWAQEIQTLLDEDDLERAGAVVTQMREERPHLMPVTEIRRVVGDYDRAAEEEAARAEQFDAALTRAEASGAEAPDREALAEAQAHVKTSEEKYRLDVFNELVATADRERQAEHNAAFRREIDALRDRFNTVRRERGDAEPSIRAVADLEHELGQLLGRSAATTSTKAIAASLRTSMQNHREALIQQRDRQSMMGDDEEELVTSLGDPDELATKLSAFRETYPEHHLASELHEAASYAGDWKTINRWSEIMGVWRGPDSSRSDVTRLIEMLEAFDDEHETEIMGRRVEASLSYLRQKQRSLHPLGDPRHQESGLSLLITHPLVDGLHVLTSRSGDRYYMAEPRKPEPWGETSQVLVRYVSSVEQIRGPRTPAQTTFPRDAFAEDAKPEPAPQQAFADEAAAWLNSSQYRWQEAHLEVLRILMMQEDMEPILKANLAGQLIQLSAESDAMTLEALREWGTHLADVSTSSDWLDPESDVQRQRDQAKERLAMAPDIKQLLSEARDQTEAVLADLAVLEPVGMIWKDSEGNIVLVGRRAAATDGDSLYALLPGEEGPTQMKIVGEALSSGVEWHDVTERLLAGSLVYQIAR